jgi:hypothetical protein
MGIISTFNVLCPTINWKLELENLDMAICPKPFGKKVQCFYNALLHTYVSNKKSNTLLNKS